MNDYRRQAIRNLARRIDMEYSEDDSPGLMTHLQDFRLFGSGRNRCITNVLRRQEELMEYDLFIFDYEYDDWLHGKHNKRHHQTVFFIRSSRLSLPEMTMRPETLLHKIGDLVGFEDIDFVRFPKFSGQYRLTGTDEEYIRHHFNDEVLNYFTVNKGWTVEALGFYLLLYRKDLLLPVDQIAKFYWRGREVYELLAPPRPPQNKTD